MYHIHKAKAKAFKVNIQPTPSKVRIQVAIPTEASGAFIARGGGGQCVKQPSGSWKKLFAELKLKGKNY